MTDDSITYIEFNEEQTSISHENVERFSIRGKFSTKPKSFLSNISIQVILMSCCMLNV